jgi:hypothetical protein
VVTGGRGVGTGNVGTVTGGSVTAGLEAPDFGRFSAAAVGTAIPAIKTAAATAKRTAERLTPP